MKRPISSGLARTFWSGVVCLISACTLCLWAEPSAAQNAKRTQEPASVPDTVAMQKEVDAMENTFTNTLQKLEKSGQSKSSPASDALWWIVGAGLLGAVVMIKYVPGLLQVRDVSYQARLAGARAAVQVHPHMAEEEKAFEIFAARFNGGPTKTHEAAGRFELEKKDKKEPQRTAGTNGAPKPVAGTPVPRATLPNREKPARRNDLVSTAKLDNGTEFVPALASHLAGLRNLISDLATASNEEDKQSVIAKLMEEIEAFKTTAEAPEWLPAWKVASALEALLKQLSSKPNSLNPSTLRTTAAAVDLIHVLSRPGIRPDLADQPPIRALAVDDDPISRHAISFTLKKTLSVPELAVNGITGLELASQNAYDAIFLDVQMPGLDGFELCAKIRKTELNRTTPVVFVTCHNDFSARAKSSAAGGQDLLAKPFLTFEMGLKALTLVLQRRLEPDEPAEPEAVEPQLVEAVG